MANELISIKIEGEQTLVNTLKKLVAPTPYMRGLRRVAQRLIDEASIYPPQKSISRRQAYGQTFQSDKQRRFFFSAIRSGRIRVPYRRTGGLRAGWKMVEGNYTIAVTNSTEAAKFAHGETTQARLLKIVGWRTIGEIVQKVEKEHNIIAIMTEEVEKEIPK